MTDPNNPSKGLDQYMAYVSKSLCKIRYENQIATGFLIKLFKGKKEFFCMMTCAHVITRDMIQQKKTISFYYDSINLKTIGITLDPNKRLIQDFRSLSEMDSNIDINIDATVIEILPEDKIPKEFYLSINEDYIDNYDSLKNKDIAIIQYPQGKLTYSYGKIKQIDKYQITHTANTKPGSSGSPILLVNTIKVVGIHQGGDEIKSENYGYCIGPIFNFFRYFTDNKKIMNKNMYNQFEIIKRKQDIKKM
jgi:hypothetical protein